MDRLEKEARELQSANGFAKHNFFEGETVSPDEAVFRLEIRPESRNPYGVVHGGALYGLADNAAGFAAHTDGRFYVTQTSTLHFLRAQTEGTVRAYAKVRHRGRSTCLISVDILGEGDKLLATGEYTFFCVNTSIVGKKGEKAE
ncbi:MAG: PaaI family thioesterase [Ruminococcaceae bacterium]|nr:PaaI family thioesterase [Oscillospiraceae bacterium]